MQKKIAPRGDFLLYQFVLDLVPDIAVERFVLALRSESDLVSIDLARVFHTAARVGADSLEGLVPSHLTSG